MIPQPYDNHRRGTFCLYLTPDIKFSIFDWVISRYGLEVPICFEWPQSAHVGEHNGKKTTAIWLNV